MQTEQIVAQIFRCPVAPFGTHLDNFHRVFITLLKDFNPKIELILYFLSRLLVGRLIQESVPYSFLSRIEVFGSFYKPLDKLVTSEFVKTFDAALEQALAADGPVVLDCIIDSDDKVWPMVAPGAAISEAFSQEDLKK